MNKSMTRRISLAIAPLLLLALLFGCGPSKPSVVDTPPEDTTTTTAYETPEETADPGDDWDQTTEPTADPGDENPNFSEVPVYVAPTQRPVATTTTVRLTGYPPLTTSTTRASAATTPMNRPTTTARPTIITTTIRTTTTRPLSTITDYVRTSTTRPTGTTTTTRPSATTTTTASTTTTTTTTTTTAPVKVTGVRFNGAAKYTLVPGGTQTLSYTISPATATNKGVTFSSSNRSVATVSGAGVVTAVADGTAIITITTIDPTADENYTATVEIEVRSVLVATISITASRTSIKVGDSLTLNATVTGEGGKTPTNGAVSWSINDSQIASITSSSNSSCTIRGVGAGEAIITATARDASGRTQQARIIVTLT